MMKISVKKDRKVTLDGEAYFEVAHNKEIPFYVQTENIKVQVTGTKFDVCSYKGSNSFIARLIEGSINLLTNSAKEEKTKIKSKNRSQRYFHNTICYSESHFLSFDHTRTSQ